MALPPQFDEPAFRSLNRVDGALNRGQAHVFRVLWFMVPPGSVAWNLNFQALLVSRFFSDLALQALLYAALISSARAGEGTADAALLGTAYLLPGLILGLYGGAVADAVPKRIALAVAYFTMGALCLLILTAFGTEFGALLLVLFAVRTLHQVVQPSEASTVPLVASEEALASATSFLSFAGSAGDVIGKALLAPLIVRAFGIDPVVVLAGILFMLSASRVFRLDAAPVRMGAPHPEVVEQDRSMVEVLRWLLQERVVLWMLLLAALASTIGVVLGMLGPKYVQEVLDVDPANALYVFAPAPIGLIAALIFSPLLIRMFGERNVAAFGFTVVAIVMAMLGLIAPVTEAFGWLLLIDIPGVGEKVEMAALLSIFLGLGMTLAAAATQTYISRSVPIGIQGRTFAVVGMLKDGLAIPPLLGIGAIAHFVGVEPVLTVAPVALLALAIGIDRLGQRYRHPRPAKPRTVGRA